jgi:outer membrane receptor protein involved in Fe transport
LLGASIFAAVPATAFAQDADPATTDTETTSEDTAAVDGDIIVTASKREQTLQDTPIAVSVTTAETIEQAQVRDLLDVQTLIPSLRVSQLQSSANTNFIIRGFGNGANNAGIEPSVGVFIDGVYRSRSAAQIGDLPNLRRIEVLRGPQSTLFGKNASAGIISVVTAPPSYEFGGSVEASYGNYNAVVLKGDITGPISETIAFSLAGNYNRRDGYADDLFLGEEVNDRNRYGVRGQLLFEPNDSLTIRLIGDYDSIDENCCIAGNIINGPTGGIVQVLAGGRGLAAQDLFSYDVYNNFLSTNEIENYGGSGQIDYEIGSFTLTSITAYREVRADTNQDSDFTGADLIGQNSQNLGIDTFTQELRIASDFDGPFNFLLGGYYFNESIDQRNAILYGTQFRPYAGALINPAAFAGPNAVANANAVVTGLEQQIGSILGNPAQFSGQFFRAGTGLTEAYTLDDEAWSIFGTVDLEVTDRLTLSGGFNYTQDRKNFSTNVVSSDAFSRLDLVAIGRTAITQQGIATTVGQALGLGRLATAAEIGAFAQANAAAFGQIQAGAAAFATANQNNPAVNPLLGLRPLQFLPPFLNVPNAVEDGRTSDNDLSYSIRASYELTDTVNIYATYATGFKASSVNLSRDSRPTGVDLVAIRAANLATPNLISGSRFAGPEESEVYEFGIKAQWDRVGANFAIFKQTVDGFQSNVFTGTGFALANAGQQSVFGFEFDGSVTPVDPLTINLAVTYLDSKYDSFVNTGIFINGQQVDLSGETPAGIPELSFNLGGVYTHEFGDDNTLALRVDYSYQSPVLIADNIPNIRREQQQLNSSLTLGLSNGLEVSVWGRNILNNRYITTVFPSVAQSGSVSGYPSQPRTYGITGRFRF